MTVLSVLLTLSTIACQTVLGIDDTTVADDSADGGADGGEADGGGEVALCGDSAVDAAAGETCDDGNTESGDGCSEVCLDETTACAPTLLGSHVPGDSLGRMVVAGETLYMATVPDLIGFPTLRIFAVGDPSAIGEVGRFSMSPTGDYPNHRTVGMAKSGDYIWLGGDNPEFISVNVADPSAPSLGHQAGPNDSGGHLDIVGTTMYIAYPVGETARSFDISGGSATALPGAIGDPGNVYYNIA
ncbi:MAG: hypothetical protein AAGC55_12830, partial [Myxococcota bacterium]